MIVTLVAMVCAWAAPAAAQDEPYYSPDQLDQLVSRVALYPDPLMAQVLAAATFPDEIPEAARWADQHRYLNGDQLAARIQDDQLPWDPSVQALLPFPAVLGTMASDMGWTIDLGNAFLANQEDLMYAVQRMRQRARDYGYLRSGPQIVVSGGPYITILPARPDYVVVPYYDPVVVYARPRPGFFVGAAIGFRFGVVLGAAYRPWGWGYNRISWNERVVVINNAPWHRTWVNRTAYVHPYTIRRVVVHDRGWNDRHEAMERERAHFAHEHAEHREAVRHEEHREAVRHEEHREAERREEHREAERRENRREAERRDDRHDAYRDARHDDHHDAYHDARHDDHHDAVRHDEHHEPVREAHNDVKHIERRDVDHSNDHGHDNHGNDNHGNNGNHNSNGKDNRGNNGNHNGNGNGKDHDDKGHGDGHGR
ncbi:MAG TPA: DUF3300 domain-containing protein [Candidatus Sulfotelmatobacter sp.]|nr:DUF3300 domain-containing protein [Candidatus Sulfotelmatobacter sp.]